jgi:Tfp pilus assembly protein PilV
MVRDGTSLVEVSVALVLAGIGVSAVASAGNSAARLSRISSAGTAAVMIAGDVLDSLTAEAAPASGETQRGAFALEWTATPDQSGTVRIRLRVWHPANRDTLVFQALGADPPRIVP